MNETLLHMFATGMARINADGSLHIYATQVLHHFAIEDTPENRDRLNESIIKLCVGQGAEVEIRDDRSGFVSEEAGQGSS